MREDRRKLTFSKNKINVNFFEIELVFDKAV